MADDDLVTLCVIFRVSAHVSISKKVPAHSVGLFSFSFYSFLSFGFITFSRIVRAEVNGGADCGKGRDNSRLLFRRNKIRAVGA